ncbi:aminopeptidase N-like [Glandiceps talaboti]
MYDKEEKTGCYVSKSSWIAIITLVILLIAGSILITYFAVQCDTLEVVEDDPYDGLPPPPEDVEEDHEMYDGYLSKDLKPIHYDVTIKTYLDTEDGEKQFTFEGEVTMEILCQVSTPVITIHAHESVKVDHDTVKLIHIHGGDHDHEMEYSHVEEDRKYEYLVIYLKSGDTLVAGDTYTLTMSYTGTLLQDDLMGYYLSNYTRSNGEEVHMSATQLETVNARRVFPCFDEPTFKATFQFTLIHRNTRKALWNMPMISTETDGSGLWNTSYFEKTNVIMSTYLVAIVIADFVSIEVTTPTGVLFRVWGDAEDIYSANYSLQTGVKQLTFFEEFWGIPYPLPKMDMVSVPDFYFGAMENWGLILTRSSYFYYDPEKHSPSIKWRIASINSHELAHMWFGNMVTTAWWDHIWLNEGLTSYYEHVGCAATEPEFETFDQIYQRDDVFRAFAADAKGSSHPVVVPGVGWPDETWYLFDRIGYEKGSSLVRMMRQFLGEDTLKDGLTHYLTKHLYGNVVTDDLFEALTEIDKGRNNYNVKLIMDTWVLQMGFPVVNVTATFDDESKTASVKTTQQHFLLDPFDEPDDKFVHFDYTWYVPLTYTHSGEREYIKPAEIWQNRGPVDFQINDVTSEDWILVNINQTGFYRVNYDTANWEKLAAQLLENHSIFTTTNRAGLIEDSFNLGHAHQLSQTIAWKVTQYLSKDMEYNPWNTVIDNIGYTRDMLKGKSTYGDMERYVRTLVTPVYENYGWDFSSELFLVYESTMNAIETACYYGNYDCVDHASNLYAEWMEIPDNNTIPYFVKPVVYCTAIKHGSDFEWEFAWQMYTSETTIASDKEYLQTAMACTKDTWILARYLESALEESWANTAVSNALDNSPVGFPIAWTFTMDNFETLLAIYDEAAYDIVWGFADYINTDSYKTQLEEFARLHSDMPTSAAGKFYDALHTVDLNIMWMKSNFDDLHKWFRETNTQLHSA